ncbi:MAG: hypothetical protein ABIH36_00935 [bacterium]
MKSTIGKNIIIQEKGVVLIITSSVLAILLFLGAYFLNFTLTEFRISQSEIVSTQSYYLAEAGINEAIWKLKNDPEWKVNFEAEPGCYYWVDSFSRGGDLFPKGSYQVQIQNSDCARGGITATSTMDLADGKFAQRVVEIEVFKSMGSFTEDSAVLTGGSSENVDINSSIVLVYDGNIFSNNNINIGWFSDVDVFDNLNTEEIEGRILAGGNLSVSSGSSLSATATCAKNVCQGECTDIGCPPDSLSAPMVDFDSSDPNSYKQKAITAENNGQCSILCNGAECGTKCVYTDNEFGDLLWQISDGGVLTLNNKITYIEGPVGLKGGREIVINGVLVADGTIDIGENYCWTKQGHKDCGYNQITVNDPGPDIASGILSKSKINIGPYSSSRDIEVVGLIYAMNELKIVSLPLSFNIVGGMIARKLSLTSAWAHFNIHLNNSIIAEGIWGGAQPPEGGERPPFSPLVTIEHWEESY